MAGIFNVKSLDTNHVTPVTEKPAPRDPKLDRECHHRQPEGCQSSPPGDPKFNSSLPEKWGVGRRSGFLLGWKVTFRGLLMLNFGGVSRIDPPKKLLGT